jgi:hypothetical protein
MTAASNFPRIAIGEPRLTLRIDEAAAALGIGPALVDDLIRTGPSRLANARSSRPDRARAPRRLRGW